MATAGIPDSEASKKLLHVDLIGVLGKRHVFTSLDKSGKPDENIEELQRTAGMDFPSRSALPFLDLLQVPRAVVYQHLFEAAKDKLEKRLLTLGEEKLINMLSATIRYLRVAELKSLPIGILKRLSHNVPLRYLQFIAKNCEKSFILNDIPVEVRQLVWLVDDSTFVDVTVQCGEKWLHHLEGGSEKGDPRVLDESVTQMCKYFGNFQALFSKFALICLNRSLAPATASLDGSGATGSGTGTGTEGGNVLGGTVRSADSRWCSLLRHVLVNLPRDKIKALGKVRDMAWQLSNFIRESNLNPENKQDIISNRKQLVGRLASNSSVIDSIFSDVADIKRVFVAAHERSSTAVLPSKTTASTTPVVSSSTTDAKNTPALLASRGVKSSTRVTSSSKDSGSTRILTFEEKLSGCWSHISKLDRKHIFARPVTESMAPGYFAVVKHPMDLSKIRKRLPSEQFKHKHNELPAYASLEEFEADLKLMFDNCFLYNAPGASVLKEAEKLWDLWLKNKPVVFGSEEGSKHVALNKAPPAPPPPRVVTVKSTLLLPPPPAPPSSSSSQHAAAALKGENNDMKAEERPAVASRVKKAEPEEPLKINIKIKKSLKKVDDKRDASSYGNTHPSFPLRTILKKSLELIWRVEGDVHINGPLIGIFSAPITEDVAPEYLSVIKHPMDLSTMRKKVLSNSYKTIDQFENDLQLIFDNCRQYNEAESVLCKIGDNLWDFWVANRRAIERNPDVSYEDLKPPRVVAENSENNSLSSAKNSKSKAKNQSKSHDKKTSTASFSSSESSSSARDSEDMRLPPPLSGSGLIGSKPTPSGLIGRKKGADISQFDDRRLTLDSVKNEKKSSSQSNVLKKVNIEPKTSHSAAVKLETQSPTASIKKEPSVTTKSFSPAALSKQATGVSVADIDSTLRGCLGAMRRAGEDSKLCGDLVGVFSSPVTEAVAPGYFAIVKRPMDLTKMKKKISSHVYKDILDFENDLKLMFDNCRLYNEPSSILCNIADILWNFWTINRPTLEENPSAAYEKLTFPEVSSIDSAGIEGNEDARPWPELAPLPAGKDKVDIKESNLLHEALERAVEFLSTEDDSKLFATDVNIPGYTDIIKKPRSLNFINSRVVKYKSVEAFESDVRLMFKNCIKFNEPNKDYFFSDLAVKLWNSWLKNRRHILLDSEEGPSTESRLQKSSEDGSTSDLKGRISLGVSGEKRGRSPVDKNGDEGKSKKSRRNADLEALAIMEDDEEEFMMEVGSDSDGGEGNDEDYSFLDEDDGEGGKRKGQRAGSKSSRRSVGVSNDDLFDEESSDEDNEHDSKQKKKKAKKANVARTASSGSAESSSSHSKTAGVSDAARKSKPTPTGSNRKKPPKKPSQSMAMTPMIPLHRLSSSKVLKTAPVGVAPVSAASRGSVPPSAPAAPPVKKVAGVGQTLSVAEKLRFSRDMLRWCVALLRDSQLQGMFTSHLCHLLLSLERSPPPPPPNRGGIHPPESVLKSLGGSLPAESSAVQRCLWLCQAGVDVSDGIYELKADQYLLREALPFLMHHHLTHPWVDEVPPPSREECETIIRGKLDLQCVTFGAEKALELLVNLMTLLLSSGNLDEPKKSSLAY